jgi:predicted CoA-binding protein
VGASSDPEKFGHRIFVTLKGAGYTVYPVNPKDGEIAEDKVYPSLADLPVKPAVVDIVVPPAVAEKIVRQCAGLGLRRVWLQPGAESQAAIRYCQENGIEVVYGDCAMRRRRRWD